MESKNVNETSNTEIITISRAEYDELMAAKAKNAELSQQNNWLMERLKLNNKKLFGSSSEKTEQEDSDQLCLFNEAEAFADESAPEPEISDVKAHHRKKSESKDRLPEDLEIEIVEHKLSDEELACPQCGHELHVMGKEVVSEQLKIIPAKAILVQNVRYTYSCRNCENNDTSVPVIKAPVPNAVIKGGFATPEAVSYIMTQKYVLDVPLNRMENDFKRRDIHLSRQTMCNWIMKCSEDWLEPIFEKLHEELLHHDVVFADETTIQVLKEPEKKPQSKSYMWLYRTDKYAPHQVALYDYASSRSAKNAQQFLKGFSGYLHCDGYQAYKTLPDDIVLVGCLAHVRRKFDEALNCLTDDQRKSSKAKIGMDYCNRIFEMERSFEELTPEDRLTKRQELVNTVLDEFLSWLNSFNPAKQSHLGRAVEYAQRQLPYVSNYLRDGRLEASNNRAEHLAKSFAVCRKNFLFSNTPRGATASAVTLSVIATAMENGLDPYKYLTYVFKEAPNIDLNNEEAFSRLLPWNAPDSTRFAAN